MNENKELICFGFINKSTNKTKQGLSKFLKRNISIDEELIGVSSKEYKKGDCMQLQYYEVCFGIFTEDWM